MRYDTSVRPWLAVVLLLACAGYAAMEYIALGYVFQNFLGWSPAIGAVVIVVATMLYVNLGGMNTVVWTEVIQYLFLFAAGAIVGIWGLSAAQDMLPVGQSVFAVPHLNNTPWYSIFSIGAFAVFTMILAYIPGWMTDQGPWQRIWMAKDSGHARRGTLMGSLLVLVVYTFTAFMAIAAWTILGSPTDYAGNVEEIVYVLMLKTLPVGAIAIAMVGFFAAAMSNISIFAVGSASNMTKDIYQRYLRPHASQKEMVFASRVIVVICLSLGIFVGMVMPNILTVLFYSATLQSTAFFVPIVGALYWRRANAKGAIACVVLGGGADLIMYYMKMFQGVVFPVEPVLPAIVIGVLAYVVVSLITKPTPTAKLAAFFDKDAEIFINSWQEAGFSSKPTAGAEQYVNENIIIRDRGERTFLMMRVKLEGADFSTVEKWKEFVDGLLKNISWAWLAGYDIVYKIVSKDMVGNPRMARGDERNEIIIYCEPLEKEKDEIKNYFAVALDDLDGTGFKHIEEAKIIDMQGEPLTT